MNVELKYIRKLSFLLLVLIHFLSDLEIQINLIQSNMPEKLFLLGSLPLSELLKYLLKVGLFDNVQILQWKGHFKCRKQLSQQLGNCAEHFVTRFLVFQPTSLAYQSQNLLEYFNQDNLDRECKILIFKTRQAIKLILWHHKLSLHLLIYFSTLCQWRKIPGKSLWCSLTLTLFFLNADKAQFMKQIIVEALLNAWQL